MAARDLIVAPERHPVLAGPLSLQSLARHPIGTYVEEFAGRRRIDVAFERAGLRPDVVLAAIDCDVIKTDVAIGMGVGIMAEMARDPARDAGLCTLPAGALFGTNRVRLALRRDAFLRGFATAFIELFMPGARL